MKKLKMFLLLAVTLLVMTLFFVGCSSDSPELGSGSGSDPVHVYHTVTWNLSGGLWGNVAPPPTSVRSGTLLPLPTPVWSDFTFDGWARSAGTLNAPITGNTTFTAIWRFTLGTAPELGPSPVSGVRARIQGPIGSQLVVTQFTLARNFTFQPQMEDPAAEWADVQAGLLALARGTETTTNLGNNILFFAETEDLSLLSRRINLYWPSTLWLYNGISCYNRQTAQSRFDDNPTMWNASLLGQAFGHQENQPMINIPVDAETIWYINLMVIENGRVFRHRDRALGHWNYYGAWAGELPWTSSSHFNCLC